MKTIQASVANAAEKKDLLAKLESVVEDKKKNEDALKSHAQELRQQLILMQSKLDRAGELDKDLHEKLKVADNTHRENMARVRDPTRLSQSTGSLFC